MSSVFEPKKRLIKADKNKRLAIIVSDNDETRVKYYRNCSDIYVDNSNHVFNKELENINLNKINFLDFKLSKNCFNEEYQDILWKYLNYGEKTKQLHVANTNFNLFKSNSWNSFCEYINDFGVSNKIHLEIHNILWEYQNEKPDLIHDIDQIKKINFDMFEIIDYYTVLSNYEAIYVNLKCENDLFFDDFEAIRYNPKSDRTLPRNYYGRLY